ncbi:HEAT repeat domain-containing protein [Neobacillus notoginsengisoli]|uniref:HEAT repeat domain-containing protein n=1 Tax=Neobacillus notoginsengisoli TaxID=1578198 RepID=A0A417YPV0_9BACI|nr:HEAT repeat domain-containing protein [Neobacillus notoginsengisoli]RHW36017.1 HEAT repeat domain-containing protein [Neobacillus notoginsengisoli]
MEAVEQLAYFDGEDVGTTVIEKLNDTDSLVRITAAEVLGRIKFKKSIPYHIDSLSDKDEVVRAYVAEALGKIGDKKINPCT